MGRPRSTEATSGGLRTRGGHVGRDRGTARAVCGPPGGRPAFALLALARSVRAMMMRSLLLFGLFSLVAACSGDDASPTTEDRGAAADAPAALADAPANEGDPPGETAPSAGWAPSAADFPCVPEMTAIDRFYVANLLGDDAATAAIARGEAPGPYPVGSLIQLIPQEAMVKRGPDYSPETGNWEYFSLDVRDGETRILDRGATGVVNQFGGDCFSCHVDAKEADFVCGPDGPCVDIPLPLSAIRALQNGDARCR